jgi:hypothetical protein
VTRDNTGAHLSKEMRSGAVGHVAAPDPTSARSCGMKLQLAWYHVDAHPISCHDLEFIYGYLVFRVPTIYSSGSVYELYSMVVAGGPASKRPKSQAIGTVVVPIFFYCILLSFFCISLLKSIPGKKHIRHQKKGNDFVG